MTRVEGLKRVKMGLLGQDARPGAVRLDARSFYKASVGYFTPHPGRRDERSEVAGCTCAGTRPGGDTQPFPSPCSCRGCQQSPLADGWSQTLGCFTPAGQASAVTGAGTVGAAGSGGAASRGCSAEELKRVTALQVLCPGDHFVPAVLSDMGRGRPSRTAEPPAPRAREKDEDGVGRRGRGRFGAQKPGAGSGGRTLAARGPRGSRKLGF